MFVVERFYDNPRKMLNALVVAGYCSRSGVSEKSFEEKARLELSYGT